MELEWPDGIGVCDGFASCVSAECWLIIFVEETYDAAEREVAFDGVDCCVCDRSRSFREGSDGHPGRDPPDGVRLLFRKTPPVADHLDVASAARISRPKEEHIIGPSAICQRGRRPVKTPSAALEKEFADDCSLENNCKIVAERAQP